MRAGCVLAAPDRRRKTGFAWVTVIVILGVLAAFAIPRFSGLETQARIAAVNGLAGSVKSAGALSKALWTATAVVCHTTSSATNIFEWQLNSALTPASCKVTYSVATTPPTTTSTSSGC